VSKEAYLPGIFLNIIIISEVIPTIAQLLTCTGCMHDIYYRHLLQTFTTDTADCDPDDSATPYLHRVYACQKRPVHIHMAKEAYSYGKRGLFIWQKRPVHMALEAYSYGKSGLFIWQKRPIHMAKEAYSYGKRGL